MLGVRSGRAPAPYRSRVSSWSFLYLNQALKARGSLSGSEEGSVRLDPRQQRAPLGQGVAHLTLDPAHLDLKLARLAKSGPQLVAHLNRIARGAIHFPVDL